MKNTPDVQAAYLAVRKPGAIKHPYPAAVALTFAKALVALRKCVADNPALKTLVPYMYGDDGKLESFAHQCAGEMFQSLLRRDRSFGGCRASLS